MANILRLTSSLLRTREFCGTAQKNSRSSGTSSGVSPGCSSSLPVVKHGNSNLSSTSKATIVSFGSF
jgi:hypothetical protein